MPRHGRQLRNRTRHFSGEDGVAVEDHEAGCRLEGNGLAKLLRDPGSRGARRDPQRTTSRRPWRKSIAAMPSRWFRRNVIQVVLALGVRGDERRSLETLRSETSEPRRSSSPRIRGAPGVLGGHPPDERSDLERQERIVGSRAMRRRSIEPGRIPALGEIVNCSSADSFG